MTRLLALLFLLLVSPVLAQGCGSTNPGCLVPTRPAGDNSNAAASTAFVGTAVSNSGGIPAGLVCDGSTDKTAAIQAAIDASYNGTITLPRGDCLVSSSGAQIFSITGAIRFTGLGMQGANASCLMIAAGTGGSTDLFRIIPPAGGIRGLQFDHFCIKSQSGNVGWNNFHFDTTSLSVAAFIAEMDIDHVYTGPGTASSGFSVYLDNIAANPGVFNSTISDNLFSQGIDMLYGGDTIRVLNNIITGPGYALTGFNIAGAGNFQFIGNNVSSLSGVHFIGGYKPIFAWNEIEAQATSTSANNAVLDIDGLFSVVDSPQIIHNMIQAPVPATGNPIPLRINTADKSFVDGNRLGTSGTYTPFVIGSAATNTIVGAANTYPGATTPISDSSTSTSYVQTAGAPSALGLLRACVTGVNFNSANTDTAIPIGNIGSTRYYPFAIDISNASHTLTTATIGLFTGTGGSGTIIADGAVTVSATTPGSANSSQQRAAASTVSYNNTSVQLRIGTAEGAAATADVCFRFFPQT